MALIKVREMKNERKFDSMQTPAYKKSVEQLKAAFQQVEKVLNDEGLELVLDARGDYMLAAIPAAIAQDVAELTEKEVTDLLDNSIGVMPNHLVTLLK